MAIVASTLALHIQTTAAAPIRPSTHIADGPQDFCAFDSCDGLSTASDTFGCLGHLCLRKFDDSRQVDSGIALALVQKRRFKLDAEGSHDGSQSTAEKH